MSGGELVSTADIAALYRVKRTTVTNKWTKLPDFPKPAQRLSQKSVFWRRADVVAWRATS